MEQNQEKGNLFKLIESWDGNNIKLALQITKSNVELKSAVEERYRPLLNFVGAKSFQSLKSLPKKLNSPKILSKDWKPDEHSIQVLKSIPIYQISLGNKSLTVFPTWLCYLSNLTSLSLANADGWWYKNKNKIKSIPQAINNLKNLKELRLSRLELENIPKELCQLSQLELLDLNYNRIEEIPNLSRLVKLSYLDLFLNRLTEIKGLASLTKLEYLQLGANELEDIDDVFEELKELRQLSLASNKLKILHDSIGSLEKLWKLDIYYLPLKGTLPASFSKLKHLTWLRIDGIGLKKLPAYLKNFKNLSTFRCGINGPSGGYIESSDSEKILAFIANKT